MQVRRVLISVSNKEKLGEFAKELSNLGIEIVSTGGTSREIRSHGVPVTEVSQLPGSFPEMLKGRVKTLQPSVLAGVLVKQDDENQMKEIAEHNIQPFQMVVVNFYPWEKKIQEIGLKIDEIIEEGMDIGGPNATCSAIKNYPYVTTVIDPNDYDLILKELKENGEVSEQLRIHLAVKASFEVVWYRYRIFQWMAVTFGYKSEQFPDRLLLGYEKVEDLKYGENPHQKAAYYKQVGFKQPAITNAAFLQGKMPSITGIMDFNAAMETAREIQDTLALVIIKHGTPCGVVKGENPEEIFEKAWAMDEKSAFGGFIGYNGMMNVALANLVAARKIDGVIAAGFQNGVLEILAKRKNMPVFDAGTMPLLEKGTLIIKPLIGGIGLQEADVEPIDTSVWELKCGQELTEEQKKKAADGWRFLKHIKSNAILVLDKDGEPAGIGGGDVSRVEAGEMAFKKAGEKAKDGFLLSDALIPFEDLVILAAEFGIKYIIQTGGSVNDEKVIAAAKEKGITMIFTKRRSFYH